MKEFCAEIDEYASKGFAILGWGHDIVTWAEVIPSYRGAVSCRGTIRGYP